MNTLVQKVLKWDVIPKPSAPQPKALNRFWEGTLNPKPSNVLGERGFDLHSGLGIQSMPCWVLDLSWEPLRV